MFQWSFTVLNKKITVLMLVSSSILKHGFSSNAALQRTIVSLFSSSLCWFSSITCSASRCELRVLFWRPAGRTRSWSSMRNVAGWSMSSSQRVEGVTTNASSWRWASNTHVPLNPYSAIQYCLFVMFAKTSINAIIISLIWSEGFEQTSNSDLNICCVTCWYEWCLRLRGVADWEFSILILWWL